MVLSSTAFRKIAGWHKRLFAFDAGEVATHFAYIERNISNRRFDDLAVGTIVDRDGEHGAIVATFLHFRVMVDDEAFVNAMHASKVGRLDPTVVGLFGLRRSVKSKSDQGGRQ